MSGIFTPDVYVAGIVGALQAQLANGKSHAQPSAENINIYFGVQCCNRGASRFRYRAIRTYLGTPQSRTTITNAIITANEVVNYFRSHTLASAGAADAVGSVAGSSATHSPITATPGRFQQKDTVTVPVEGGQLVTIDLTVAAGIGAIVNDEPALQEDELGNALASAMVGGFALTESVVQL
jgi:hypothetical protein